jgi:DNA primase
MSTNASSNGRAKAALNDLAALLQQEVYPRLFDHLDAAFPEYAFVKRGDAWEATRWPGDFPCPAVHQTPGRLMCYPDRQYGVKVHGRGVVRWLDILNRGTKPTGGDFPRIVRILCEKSGVRFPEREMTEEEAEASRLWEERRALLAAVETVRRQLLWQDDLPKCVEARKYANARGFPDEALKAMGFGFHSGEHIARLLRCNGYDAKTAWQTGLLTRSLDGYLVAPWCDDYGAPLTSYGRWPDKDLPFQKDHPGWWRKRNEAYERWRAGTEEEKAKNPWVEPHIPKTNALSGNGSKSSPLYFDLALKAGHLDIVAVEGVWDAALLQWHGDTRVVAYVAAQFSGAQVETLARRKVRSVTIVPDPDSGGSDGAESSVKSLIKHGIISYVAKALPDGLDPDEFLNRDGIDTWRSHIADPTPGAIFLSDRILKEIKPESPEIERRNVVSEIGKLYRTLKEELDRTAVLKHVAERTGFGVSDLKKQFKAEGGKQKRKGAGKRSEGGKDQEPGDAKPGEPGKGFYFTYDDTNGFLRQLSEDREGTATQEPIANYTARIKTESLRHSGGKVTHEYLIEATNISGVKATATIDAETFAKQGVGGALGGHFTVEANREKQVRAAIQFLSNNDGIHQTHVYTHTGWINHKGVDLYLHAGGAIGDDGPSHLIVTKDDDGKDRYEDAPPDQANEIRVELDAALAKYRLPNPPLDPNRRRRAIRADLGLLDLGKDGRPNSKGIAAVTIGLPYRAVLRENSGTVHFSGGTGAGKTTVASLVLQHFAPEHAYDQPPPATWEATINSIQRLQHDAKDTTIMVDELVADGPTADRDLAKASSAISSQGNLAGKRRMKQDLSLAASMDPRGTLLSTGETDPTRRSALGRSLVVQFTPASEGRKGSIELDELTPYQKDAAEGLFAESMACYVQWLAGDLAAKRERHRKLSEELLDEARSQSLGAHPRCARIVAELGAAFQLFTEFAVEVKAITEAESDRHVGRQWEGLLSLLDDQAETQVDADPGRRFLSLLASALSSGRAYLAGLNGRYPEARQYACGWIQGAGRDADIWEPAQASAPKVGWIEGTHVYLNREAAMAVAQELGLKQRHPLNDPREVWKRLRELGILSTATRGEKVRYDVRKVLEGTQREVAKLLASALWPAESGPADGDDEDDGHVGHVPDTDLSTVSNI